MATQIRNIPALPITLVALFEALKAGILAQTTPACGSAHLVRTAATGGVFKSGLAKGTSQPATVTTQPDCPRVARLTTSGWTSTASVAVTITGVVRGVAGVTETITVVAAGTTVSGVVPFERITGIAWTQPAGWSAGTISVTGGAALGIPLPPGFGSFAVSKVSVWDETATPPVPADETVGTVDATNGTLAPTTAPDAAHSYRVLYSYATPALAGRAVHLDASEVTVDSPTATDLATSLVMVNRARLVYEAGFGGYPGHRRDILAHVAADTANATTSPVATTLATAITLANELKADINAHLSQSGVHRTNDTANTIAASDASDLSSLVTLANAIKAALNAHMAAAVAIPGLRIIPA
jgi:hypothetical protein